MKASRLNEIQATLTAGDDRWKALLERAPSADGKFVYAVKTTGVYCVASCASRLPRPENVIFFASARSARRSGFRACKRCKPDELVRGASRGERIGGTGNGRPRKSDDIHFAIAECSVGSFLVAQSGQGVCAILLGTDPRALVQELQTRFPRASLFVSARGLENLLARVARFLDAPAIGHDLRLDVRGTSFQRRVWHALRKIEPGQIASYVDIARRIGSPRAVRAVAQACGANPLAVAIPCHRVVRNDGHLSGYRWGIERKRILLEREARQ